VKDYKVVTLLEKDYKDTLAFLQDLPKDKFDYYYSPGKWSLQEIVQHLIDVERVFVYRALRFSRLDPTDLQGFDQENYLETVSLEDVSFENILNEWRSLRESTIFFYKNLNLKSLNRTGRASGFEFSVKSIAYILTGHSRHHIEIIKEKYL
jgi:hypothetical protein